MQQKHWIGLSDSEVINNREKYGANILTPVEQESIWRKFLSKFKDPTIIILMVAAVLSFGVSLYEIMAIGKGSEALLEPLGILIAVLLATGLSFYFEHKADKEFTILNKVNDEEQVRVIRNGHTTQIPKRDVVVGDLIVIETGDEVPADAKLLDAMSLMVDESTLTGEPIAAKVTKEDLFDPEATFPSNHVMRGTKVVEGHGLCEAFAVGDRTENGKVFKSAQIDDTVKTPLNEQLDKLGNMISKIGYGIAIAVFVGRIIVYMMTNYGTTFMWDDFLSYLLQTIMLAVTIVVVAVPEGLPMAVTLSLAYSMQRMLKTNNLVRKMHACETMGATTVICTDKTGTLTENQMRVSETLFFGFEEQVLKDDEESILIKENIALNSTATIDTSEVDEPKVFGNPTEGALLLWLHTQGVDTPLIREEVRILQQIPFSTERKYMVTEVQSKIGKRVLYIKGAPEIVAGMTERVIGNKSQDEIERQLAIYQSEGRRTLGFAYQELSDNEPGIVDGKLVANHLLFQGIVAIADPVRSDVPNAVETCLLAGIDVKIVTGDTIGTAREVARQIRLWHKNDGEEQILTGPEIADMSDEELQRRIGTVKIISRARPLDKRRLVEALQRNNEVVAVTGDGTNDAPALKAAHVGLSMGDGTAIAKEASDITIIDNSFASIGRAVMWGRSLYQNIQRFILFQMTINVVACLIVLAGAFLGTQSPLTVTQMLWVNLIMDTFAAMALASLPPSGKVMEEHPRDRNAFIINEQMAKRIFGIGGVFFLLLLGLLFVFQHTNISSLQDLTNLQWQSTTRGISRYEQSLFFTLFVWLQFWNMFNAKAYMSKQSAFHFKGASGFILIAFVIVVGQIIIVTFGGEMFNVVPLSTYDWMLSLLITSPVLILGELIRFLDNKKAKVEDIH